MKLTESCAAKSGVKFATAKPFCAPETIRGTPSGFRGRYGEREVRYHPRKDGFPAVASLGRLGSRPSLISDVYDFLKLWFGQRHD